VVMAVAQLYFHLAPKAEVGVIAKALVRLLRSHSEVQYVVLQNVATMSIKRRVSTSCARSRRSGPCGCGRPRGKAGRGMP